MAQVFAFLVAGTDTLSSNLTYCIYELAKHPHLQDRLRKEVQDAFPDGIDSLTYDKVTGLKFLYSVVMGKILSNNYVVTVYLSTGSIML